METPQLKLLFEHDYQKKLMSQAFSAPIVLKSNEDVLVWRQQWTDGLKTWHSPYKCLVDCRSVSIQNSEEVQKSLIVMHKFLSGLFLRKAVGWGFDKNLGHELLPFPVKVTEEEALTELGIREINNNREKTDFRQMILLENHFRQHTVELSFSSAVEMSSEEQLTILKSKLTNNLMQWHSKWNLIIDCSQLTFSPALEASWLLMERYFRGFFLKQIVGYGASSESKYFPFKVYRARHKAAAILEAEGMQAGDDADCKSKKLATSSQPSNS